MRQFLQSALLTAMASLLAAQASGQFFGPAPEQRKLPPAFATAKRKLEIPFTITPGTTPESQVVRVDVLMSVDHGRNWFKYAEVPPDAGKFGFAVNKDMEVWLLTQTVTAKDSRPKDEVKWPQMRLIVDTQKPDLKMTALVNPSGQPELSWTVTDATLSPKTFKIEYQDASDQDENWHPVELSARDNSASTAGIVGKKVLKLHAGTKAINVRAEATDVAGNRAVFSQHLTLPSQQELAAGKQREERGHPLADNASKRWPDENERPPEGISGLATNSAEAESSADKEPEPKLVTNPFTGKGRLAALPGSEDEGTRSEADLPPPAESLPPGSSELPAEESPQRPDTNAAQDDIGPIGGPRRESLPSTTPSRPAPDPSFVDNGNSIPAGDRTRLTKTRKFHLNYDVDIVGPEGVAEVELWGTSDGGKTWAKWGADIDRTSPMEVEVSREAAYGFRIVVVGKNGLVGNRPASGDEADIWIEIDATAPTVRITSAAYGTGEHAGELDIRWEAGDQHLGPRPVTLSFSDRADGRFTTIAAGLPNTGQYFWKFDPRSPRQFYLKLEVRDDAGNVAADQLADPIKVEGLTPKGRIRSLTPAGE